MNCDGSSTQGSDGMGQWWGWLGGAFLLGRQAPAVVAVAEPVVIAAAANIVSPLKQAASQLSTHLWAW
jgi:hypothetical protein